MDIYFAISDFTPPIADGSQNILEFEKGDSFEIFDCHKTSADWWGARALKTNSVGYVPSRYMQYEEKKIGKLLPTDYKDQQESSLKRLSDMQASPDHRAPDEVMPQTPVPDYDDISQQNVFNFAAKFKTVIMNVQNIEDLYIGASEPMPDYNEDDTEARNHDLLSEPQRQERSLSQSSDEGLLIPGRKVPNPCVENNTRQALHKELLQNYKMGVNVLEKTELEKRFKDRRETQRKKDWEVQKQASTKRTSLEMKLEQRANRLKEDEEMKTITEDVDDANKPEFQKMFDKITHKSNGQVK